MELSFDSGTVGGLLNEHCCIPTQIPQLKFYLQCSFLKCCAKPYVLHGKGLTIKIGEVLWVRLKVELELVRVETLFFISAKFFILCIHAIFPIAQQGMADRGKMGADLMRSAG